MSQLTAIADALTFTETHLKDDISVSDMAEAASYSLYHFSRVFNGLVHHTPYDYLMRRRLSESTRWLAETDRKIVDIAFEYHFGSHETFSRAFKRMFGMPPSEYRELSADAGGPVNHPRHLPPLTADYLKHINQQDLLWPDPEEQPPIDVTGLMSWVDQPSAVSTLWEALERELHNLARGPQPEAFYGIIWYPRNRRGQGYFYLAGFLDPWLGPLGAGRRPFHPGLVTKTLPDLVCARFVHSGARGCLPFTRGYIYHTWFSHASWGAALPMEIERWGDGGRPPRDGACACDILVPISSTEL